MSSVRTLNQLYDALDKELAWRKKEVTTFDMAARKGGVPGKFYVRAGVTLLYAHWEGFVKFTAQLYLDFIHNTGATYDELKACFSVIGLKGKLDLLAESRKSERNVEAFNFIREKLKDRVNLSLGNAINTESNLSSGVFKNILYSIGIDFSPYETKFNLIDVSLLEKRNKIAHGEYLDIDGRDFSELLKDVLLMMEMFKSDILNSASTGGYREVQEAV